MLVDLANRPERPRTIIDRKRLLIELTAIAETSTDQELRGRVIARLRDVVETGRAEIRRRFEAQVAESGSAGRHAGGECLRAHSYMIDQLLRLLYEFAYGAIYPAAQISAREALALIAVGGYGRRELSPQSDIDILFLIADKAAPRAEQVVEWILYTLWDLGFKVGHATRSVDEALRRSADDVTIRTALLDARYLWGDSALAGELMHRQHQEITSQSITAFIEAKLAERDDRHERMGGSRYALEPNIKDGKGGLRDLHTLFWIIHYAYPRQSLEDLVERGILSMKELQLFFKAQEFLWTLRCHLHYVSGRPEERLTFDIQPEISRRMGYTDHAGSRGVERLMRHYFLVAKDVGDLTRIFCAALESEHKRRNRSGLRRLASALALSGRHLEGFAQDGGRLTITDPKHFETAPLDLVRLFRVAQQHGLDIHPNALRLVTRNLKRIDRGLRESPEAAALFLAILTDREDPETILRRMNEAGVLGRLIPDFGRVVAQMQYNMYHHYTVDEHTLKAIGILSEIERGLRRQELPIASAVVHKVLSRRVLYMALFMHDIAKGRPGDHSVVGAQLCEQLCPILGFSEEETETVAWLVRWHLLMSDIAFKRDIEDPKTVADFAAIVQSPERLRLLLVLTCADIRAVGPGVWNNWKATLLRRLYTLTAEQLEAGAAAEGREQRVAAAKQALAAALSGWSAAELDRAQARGTAAYWLSFGAEEHALHARMVREAEAGGAPLIVETRVDVYHGVTQVTILARDEAGLLPKLAGALSLSGATIVRARIFTFDNGMALDTFSIQDAFGSDGEPGPFDRPERLAKLSVHLQRAISGEIDLAEAVAKRRTPLSPRAAVFRVAPRVLIDNAGSATHTILEVNGRDRPGFLFTVTSAMAAERLQVYSASIATFGERAIDVFYVKDGFGVKLQGEARLKAVQDAITRAIAEEDRLLERAADGRRAQSAAA